MEKFFMIIGFIVLLPTILAFSLLGLSAIGAIIGAIVKTLAAPFTRKRKK